MCLAQRRCLREVRRRLVDVSICLAIERLAKNNSRDSSCFLRGELRQEGTEIWALETYVSCLLRDVSVLRKNINK